MIDTILGSVFVMPLFIVVFICIVGILVFAYVVAILVLSLLIGLYEAVIKALKDSNPY